MSHHTRMETEMAVERPSEVLFTMRITMSLADWVALREQLGTSQQSTTFPACHLQAEIRELALKAHQSFVTSEEPE